METRGAQNARAELFDGATWYLTPAGRDRARAGCATCTRCWPRSARRPVAIDAGAHDRLLAAHEPPAARAREPARRTRRAQARIDGHDPLDGDRRLVPRHDARGRREPAHLGRHLPRQPRGAARRAARAPALARTRCWRRSRRATRATSPAGSAQASGHRRRALEAAVRRAARGALPRAGARARPPRRDLRHHAGARRGAHQHRGLRAAPLHARARRHGRARRRRRDAAADAPSSCSTRRATARSRRRSPADGVSAATGRRPPARRAGGRARRRARRAGRQVGLAPRACCSARSPTARSRSTGSAPNADTLSTVAAVESLGARVERLDEAPTRLRVHGCRPARPAARRTARSTSRNAGTLLRLLPGHPGRPERHVHARRRRVDPPPPGRPRRDAAAPDGRRARRHATAARRCTIDGGGAAAADQLRAAGRLGAGQVVRPARRPVRRATARRS